MEKPLAAVVDFLFEAGALARLIRSGFPQLLGTGTQDVAQHTNRVCFVGYALAAMDGSANADRIIRMCLFHDLTECRTGDLNSINKRYVRADHESALEDQVRGLPFGDDIRSVVSEFEAGATREAQLARDADHIELLLTLQELLESGEPRAADWIDRVRPRVATDLGCQLADAILAGRSDRWWKQLPPLRKSDGD